MATVLLQVATVDATLPAGITSGKLRFTLTATVGTVFATQDVDALTATFSAVVADTYTATAQRLDSTGANLGTPFSISVVVGTSTGTTFAQPSSMTATVTP
jgi:hypothetical protein